VAKKKETKLKEKVLGALHTLPETFCVKIQQVVIRGTPDILACIRGHFVALELKSSPDEDPDALQQYTLDQIEKAGGLSLVVDPVNWPEVFQGLKNMAYGEEQEEH
jgi:hypothetical protein